MIPRWMKGCKGCIKKVLNGLLSPRCWGRVGRVDGWDVWTGGTGGSGGLVVYNGSGGEYPRGVVALFRSKCGYKRSVTGRSPRTRE